MVEQSGTFERLLKAIENGAKLRIGFSSDFEGGIYFRNARIVRGENEVQISISTAVKLSEHPNLREGYAGYRSDYTRRWDEMYEHRNSDVPRWVTEQWTFDY